MPGLTIASLTGLLNTTLPDLKKQKFVGSQALQSYPIAEKFVMASGAGGTGKTYEYRLRLQPNTGATRAVNMYQATTAQRSPAPVVASVPWAIYENKGIIYDLRELSLNTGAAKIISIYESDRDANYEDIASRFENDMIGLPTPVSGDTPQKLLPLYYWARPSMNSSGTYQALPAGGFNGTYIKWADGSTPSAIVAGQDCSTAANSRMRNWVFTHDSVMNRTLAAQIRKANNYTRFRAFPQRIGEIMMGSVSIFMNQTLHEDYLDLINAGPDDRETGNGTADIFPFQNGTIAGASIVRTPSLDSDALVPIFGVRMDAGRMRRKDDFWFLEGKPREKPDAHNVVYIPIDVMGQFVVENIREGIWLGHTSF